MSKILLTSDSHFGHANVIPYCQRPFRDVAHMNEVLIQNWNSVVNPEDEVIHLGDFSFNERVVAEILPRLNGKKTLVLGNHDKPHPANKGKTPEKFLEWVNKYQELGWHEVVLQHKLTIDGVEFLLAHLPYKDPDDFYQGQPGLVRYVKHRPQDAGVPQLCGHVHERWLTRRTLSGTLMLNVGVDAPGAPWKMRPATLEEVFNVYKQS